MYLLTDLDWLVAIAGAIVGTIVLTASIYWISKWKRKRIDPDAGKNISVCSWFQLESFATWEGLFSKYDTNSLRSLLIGVEVGGKFAVAIEYNNGDSGEFLYRAGSLVTGRWYHYGFTYNDSDKAWKLVVWDDFRKVKESSFIGQGI